MSTDTRILDSRRFTGDVVWTFSSSMIMALAGVLLNVVVGNEFDAGGLGVYSLFLAVYSVVTVMAPFGIHVALVKFVAQYEAEHARVNQYISAGLILLLVIGVLTGILLAAGATLIARLFGTDRLIPLLRVAAISLPFFIINKALFGVLNGFRRMRAYSLNESLRYVGVVTLVFVFVASSTQLVEVAWAFVAAEMVVSLTLILATRRLFHLDFTELLARSQELLLFGFHIFASQILAQTDSYADILLVGYFLTESEVGVYAVAAMFARGLLILPRAIQVVVRPMVTNLYYNDALASLRLSIGTLVRYTFVFLLVVEVTAEILFGDLIGLVFPGNARFLAAVQPFRIILIGTLFLGSLYAVMPAPTVSIGRPDLNTKRAAMILSSSVLFNVLLVPRFGIVGGAVATTLSFMIASMITAYLLYRMLGIRITESYIIKGVFLAIGVCLVVWTTSPVIPPIIAELLGIVGILIALYPLGLINRQDVMRMRRLVSAIQT